MMDKTPPGEIQAGKRTRLPGCDVSPTMPSIRIFVSTPNPHFKIILPLLLLLLTPSGSGAEAISASDSTGCKLEFERPPARIISLNPDFTENLFALGLGDKVVGVSRFCDYPVQVREKEKIGNLSTPDLEKIISLSPDLVLATREGNRPETVEALRRIGIRVFVADPAMTFADYFQLLAELGRILGREKTAQHLAKSMQTRIEYFRAQSRTSPRIKVFFQLGTKPIVSANRETFIHELITIAGGFNLAADLPLRYPVLSREKVIAEDPEVIIIAAMGNEAEQSLVEWQSFPQLQAVRRGRIHLIDPDLVCRLTPRLLTGLEQIANFLHPEWAKTASE